MSFRPRGDCFLLAIRLLVRQSHFVPVSCPPFARTLGSLLIENQDPTAEMRGTVGGGGGKLQCLNFLTRVLFSPFSRIPPRCLQHLSLAI